MGRHDQYLRAFLRVCVTQAILCALIYSLRINKINAVGKGGSAAEYGGVATENELCSNVGIGILKKGGSVVDSAISSALCLGVTNMYSTGIGGGGFMLTKVADKKAEFFDFREVAPMGTDRLVYERNPTYTRLTGHSVAVPGEIMGFYEAHLKYGVLPWNQLFSPAIRIAEDGWEATEYLAARAKRLLKTLPNDHPSYEAYYRMFTINGKSIEKGSIVRRKNYANTLRTIAILGPDSFYRGEIAQKIAKIVAENDGVMTLKDLESYKVKISDAISVKYKEYDLITTPLPTSGLVLAFILKTFQKLRFEKFRSLNNIRMMVETFKHGYAHRSHYGDPIDPDNSHLDEYMDFSLSEVYVNKVAGMIRQDRKTHSVDYYNPNGGFVSDSGTTHLSVVDKHGNVALITSTINLPFGSLIIEDETGIILNNEMDDFSVKGNKNYFNIEDSPANYVYPGKRPMSSAAPAILAKDGVPVLGIGASGGSHITTAIAQTIADIFEFGISPEDAINLPRIHHQLLPNRVDLEEGVPEEIYNYLKSIGHEVQIENFVTGVQMILYNHGKIEAYSDPRKHGIPAVE